MSGGVTSGAAERASILPRLRPELDVIPGTNSESSARFWLIYDPVQHRYFRIDQTSYELLSLWPNANDEAALLAAARSHFDIQVDEKQISDFAKFLVGNNLVDHGPDSGWRTYASAAKRSASAQSHLSRLVHQYLFFRIPLLRPQKFLVTTLPFVALLFSRMTALVILLLGLLGVYLVSRQWDEFVRTTDFLFSWQGMLSMAIALIFVKSLHELGHAYTAVRHGCYVTTMGVAFMMLTPMPYTDVTDAWKLRDRRKRLTIDGAGIVVELSIACIATFLWAFLPDGPVRSAVFMLAAAGWILSLAINLNPFMRFDGYFLFSSFIGVENLQARAFAIGRWRMREILFGVGRSCPEDLPSGTVNALVAWAWATWVYRAVLFIGIALFVYAYFFKVLGVLLFLIEIIFLVMRPVWSELKEWYSMRREIVRSKQTFITAFCVGIFILLIAVPWSNSVTAPAMLRFAVSHPVHSPMPARIRNVHVKLGKVVEKGELLFTMQSDRLVGQIEHMQSKRRLAQLSFDKARIDSDDRHELIVLEKRLASLDSQLAALRTELDELSIRAAISGRILELDPQLHVGRLVERSMQLALIGRPDTLEAAGYIPEQDVWRVEVGTVGKFVPVDLTASSLDVRVEQLAVAGTEDLSLKALASVFGGPIAVEQSDDRSLVPVTAQFLARLSVLDPVPSHALEQRGTVQLVGRPESFIARIWRRVLGVLVRESGI